MGSRCTPPGPVIGRRFPQEGSVTFTENGGGVSREGFSEGCQQAAVPKLAGVVSPLVLQRMPHILCPSNSGESTPAPVPDSPQPAQNGSK